MACVCCGCNECPNDCSFDVDVSVDDTLGTATESVSPASCTTCNESASNPVDYSGDTVTASAYNGGSGTGGFGRADEYESAGGVAYTRAASITVNIDCDFSTKKRIVEATLIVSDSQNTDPFTPGIGFQKRQTLDIVYSLLADIGCADAIDDITVVGDLSGVTINGTSYSWTVDSYVDVCEELDGSNVYQPCGDYLTPNVPEVTVTFSKRAGC